MRIYRLISFLFATISFFLISPIAYPCTTFILRKGNNIVFGRNLDWITGTGLMITNPRDLQKVSIADPSEKTITWVSKFGSITFNQVGRDLPYGGLNEAGLVVENMTLDETVYPSKDNRYALGACQWIQFQLDNFSTVEEVISSDSLVRIADNNSKFHYLVCDRFGHSAVIEFLNGKMVCHTGQSLPVEALANSSYDKSVNCFVDKGDIESDRSLYNFCTAAYQTRQCIPSSSDSMVNDAFSILDNVKQGVGTKWSIVYDITNMRIFFRIFETPRIVGENKIFTKPGESILKVVDLRKFDFNCQSPARVIDLDNNHDGLVNAYFTDYSTSINREFIFKAFKFFNDWGVNITVSPKDLESLAKYPDTFHCVDR